MGVVAGFSQVVEESGMIGSVRTRPEDKNMTDENKDLPSDAIAALERGSKIDAIKCVRVARGVGLKEAKEIVEQFLDRSPRLKGRMASANAESARGFWGWSILAAIVAVAVYYLFGVKP